MPGLIRGMARTAVVAGTATSVSNRVSRRQAARWDQPAAAPPSQQGPPEQHQAQTDDHPAPAAPAPPALVADDLTTQLQRLADLHGQGVLSDAEFAAARATVLGG